MIISNMVFSGIRLSRPLDENELLEFESISYININEIEYTGVEMITTDSTFPDTNTWVINGIRLEIEDTNKQHFFIETLLYLIKNFFQPKNIYLNGHLFATDDLFGSHHCYYITNNHILVNQEAINYFDKLILCKDIFDNHRLVKNHMKEIIDKN